MADSHKNHDQSMLDRLGEKTTSKEGLKDGFKGKLIVISGPSGVGKGTICKELTAKHTQFVCAISATTRQKRVGEVDGVHYYFLALDDFKSKIEAGQFLEWAKVYDNYYGTLICEVEAKLNQGFNVILEIDTAGGKQIKAKMPQALMIFIMPPSIDELEFRLRGRGTDAEDVIAKRLQCCRAELEEKKYYDYLVVNDQIERAVSEVVDILEKKL